MRTLPGAGLIVAAGALFAAAGAQAQTLMQAPPPGTIVQGGAGLAEACAEAAKSGEVGVRAEQTCATALETLPLIPLDRAGTLVNLGVIRLRSGRFQQASDDFTTAIRYQPDLAEAYVNRGAARIGLRQFKDSVADLDKALSLNVKEPEKAYYDRGLANDWLENPKAAYADYRKALALAPTWALAKDQLYRFSVTHADLVAAAEATPPAPTPQP